MCSAISLVSCHRPRSVWVCVLCSAPVGGTAEKRGLRPAHLRLCACRERASTDLWAISLYLYRHQLVMEGPTGGRTLRRLVTRVLRWEDPRPEGMPKYGCREIADLGSRCSRGCWIRARFQARQLYRVRPPGRPRRRRHQRCAPLLLLAATSCPGCWASRGLRPPRVPPPRAR